MQARGPAQIELIRRYARTLWHLQTQAVTPRCRLAASRDARLREQAARLVHTMEPHGGAGPTLPAA